MSKLPLDLPLPTATVRNPQSVLRNAPSAILHTSIVYPNRIRIFEGAATLTIDGPCAGTRRAIAPSATEASGVIRRGSAPRRSAVIIPAVRRTPTVPRSTVSGAIDREFGTASLIDPHLIAAGSPSAPLSARCLAQLADHLHTLRVTVSWNLARLILVVVRRTSKFLCVRRRSCETHNRHQQQREQQFRSITHTPPSPAAPVRAIRASIYLFRCICVDMDRRVTI
jgi:hypothetical protein